jgi:hypothetical protein
MDVGSGAHARSKAGAVLREVADAVIQVVTSGIVAWILYVSISQIVAVAPDALTAEIFGRVTQWFGLRAPWVAVICIVLVVWWAQIRARGGKRGVLHGLQLWLLQRTYSWSLVALAVFAIVVVAGAVKQSLADLRWLRGVVFLAVDISVLIACRLGYERAVMKESR